MKIDPLQKEVVAKRIFKSYIKNIAWIFITFIILSLWFSYKINLYEFFLMITVIFTVIYIVVSLRWKEESKAIVENATFHLYTNGFEQKRNLSDHGAILNSLRSRHENKYGGFDQFIPAEKVNRIEMSEDGVKVFSKQYNFLKQTGVIFYHKELTDFELFIEEVHQRYMDKITYKN